MIRLMLMQRLVVSVQKRERVSDPSSFVLRRRAKVLDNGENVVLFQSDACAAALVSLRGRRNMRKSLCYLYMQHIHRHTHTQYIF